MFCLHASGLPARVSFFGGMNRRSHDMTNHYRFCLTQVFFGRRGVLAGGSFLTFAFEHAFFCSKGSLSFLLLLVPLVPLLLHSTHASDVWNASRYKYHSPSKPRRLFLRWGKSVMLEFNADPPFFLLLLLYFLRFCIHALKMGYIYLRQGEKMGMNIFRNGFFSLLFSRFCDCTWS
jgi:hypothetical protein